jgi:hypothetical protein
MLTDGGQFVRRYPVNLRSSFADTVIIVYFEVAGANNGPATLLLTIVESLKRDKRTSTLDIRLRPGISETSWWSD